MPKSLHAKPTTTPISFSSAPSLQAILRSSTNRAHHTLDHHPFLSPLVRADLQITQYIRILWAFSSLYQPLQSRLSDAASQFGWLPPLPISDRISWLEQDVRFLDPEQKQKGNIQSPANLPTLDTQAAWVGTTYVLEGSTLGGIVISRLIKARLGLGPDTGGRFFYAHGPLTHPHWEQFLQFAESKIPIDKHSACTEAANCLFGIIRQYFDLADAYWKSRDHTGCYSSHSLE